jgi:ATP adenylyltransferase
MELIRAPWRLQYVTKGVDEPGCLFCRALAEADDERNLVVHVGDLNFVVVNLYPYNSGHVMIAPKRHVGSLADASDAELAEMMSLARRIEGVLREAYHPDGLNLGMNLGRPSGAGVVDHIHLHVVPRWTGDTNFMTVSSGTRVVPEDPVEAAARLRAIFEKSEG